MFSSLPLRALTLRRAQRAVSTAARATATQLYIDGEFRAGAAATQMAVTNPASNETVWEVACAEDADVDAAVAAARKAFDSPVWGVEGPNGKARGAILQKMAADLRAQLDVWAEIETLDNGKPLEEAKADIDACAGILEYYAGLAVKLDVTGDVPADSGDADLVGSIRREPIGVIGMITPWNFPLLQSVAKVAPAIAAGCTMVLKPSPLAPMTTLKLGELAASAGLPAGVLNIINGPGNDCGVTLVAHNDLDKVSFTGSTRGGKQIMKACAEFPRPVSLELGGKGALIVFDDADLDSAVDWIMVGIFMCSGQICSASSRLLVHESVADELIPRLVEATKKIKLGNPLESGVTMGPLISETQADNARRYLEVAKACPTSRVLTGAEQAQSGALAGASRAFVDPVIVDDVPVGNACWAEEIFGPFLSVRRFSTEEEAVRLANDSPYGLAHGALTRDTARADRLVRSLRAGTVWINCNNAVPASMPFGGYKASGFGREMGPEGLDDYLQSKSVLRAKQVGFSWKWYA